MNPIQKPSLQMAFFLFFCSMMTDLKRKLEESYERFNNPGFIPYDPICIPHQFNKKEDIEVAGFLTSLLSWGQRKTIISKSHELMDRMDNKPFDFLMNAKGRDFIRFENFKHRTFNGDDCLTILQALQHIYTHCGGLEVVFTNGFSQGGAFTAIENLYQVIFSLPHLPRTRKHIARPSSGSAAKRINMFLRWMVRNDGKGVDFGLWKSISSAQLICPLDVHSGNVARAAGLLQRQQNDWKSAEELTANLRVFDSGDPVKYDFALFGAGVNKESFF